jgi:protein-tyrosine phosphatase
MTPVRHVPLNGTTNLRDLGGYPTSDGRKVRWRAIYRSSNLSQLTDDDLAVFGRLRIRTVCDFRGDEERAAAPSRLPTATPPRVVNLGIRPKVGGPLQEILRTGETRGIDLRSLIIEAYRAYARDHAAQYRGLFAELIEGDNHPLLFHCAAGKDRTGFAAAIVLTALGVPRASVFEDYELTNHYWKGPGTLSSKLDPKVRAPLLAADPAYLEAAFAGIDATFGSTEAYFREGLGLDSRARERLRAQLLE